MNALADRIWTTCKSRIRAEERLLQNEKIANFAVIWYSLWLFAWTVFEKQLETVVPYSDKINLVFSVALMVISTSLYGLKFGQQAEYFKSCYHSLQVLEIRLKHARRTELPALEKAYVDIIAETPNHSEFDYLGVIVSSWWRGNPVREIGRDALRIPSEFEIASFILLTLFRWLFFFVLFALPASFPIYVYLVSC